MRIYAAALGLEANSFIAQPTSYQAFRDKLYYPPGTHPDSPTHQTAAVFVAKHRAARDGFTVIDGPCYAAQPGGPATRAAFERMRDEILDHLKASLPVDGIALSLHGAMIADGYEDCEGDLLRRIRALVGDKVPVAIELDPHCNLTVERCRLADIIVLFKEYPHIDFVERGEELLDMLLATIRGEIRPVKSLWDCRLIQNFPTTRQPMRGFVDRIMAMERKDKVLSISVGHGFQSADMPESGARILVITDDAKAQGDAVAEALGRELWAIKDVSDPPHLEPGEAIEAALKAYRDKPIVIADTTDNAGGGAPSDNTTFIRELLARGVTGAAVGPVWDPVAVRFCHDAGLGAKLPLRFGGKAAKASGPPVDADVEIIGLSENGSQTFGGGKVPLGATAAIRANGVEVVLITTRAQAMGLDLFGHLGIDPAAKKILVVKSNQHFHAAYAPIAADVLYADGDGPMVRNVLKLDYKRIARPIWPFDAVVHPKLLL